MKHKTIGWVCALLLCASTAQAINELQLYIEGATYDNSSQTWVTTDGIFKLWAIGDVEKKGTIFDVWLTAAYDTSESGLITLTPTTTSLLTDPSTPGVPTVVPGVGSDGDIPVMGDGDNLPTHGIFGSGTSFTQWLLGDFSLLDSPIGDFMTSFPGSFPDQGQINVYEVSVTGFTNVHFDLFDHYISKDDAHYVKAPFSHDAEGGGNPPDDNENPPPPPPDDNENPPPPPGDEPGVPEPMTAGLSLLGLAGLTLKMTSRRRGS